MRGRRWFAGHAIAIVLAFVPIGSTNAAVAGSICVASGSFDAFAKGGATVEQEEAYRRQPAPDRNAVAVRFVQVDGRAPVRVTSAEAGRISGLNTARKHTVVIAKQADMSEPVATFTFTFKAKGSTNLCLRYESFYGSWILQPAKGSVCTCGRPTAGAA